LPPIEKINNLNQCPVCILIAPLDWGLGHTTRCIPIIKAFMSLGAEVTVACNAKQAHLLCSEINFLNWISIDGYDLKYGRSSLTTHLKLFLQVPKILTAIKRENRWLKKIAKEKKFDIIISDNRYGLRHDNMYSIFISHQLLIRVPFSSWLQKLVQKWNYRFINSFNECWVPDHKEVPNLSGELAHPQQMPGIPIRYIGPLSRFKNKPCDSPIESFVLFIISGPEPQRTIFEKKIENELKQYNGRAIVLRGLPGQVEEKKAFGKISFINHLHTDQLNKLMQQAEFVFCRSGYSSIMDIISLQKKSVLVPTPGQTEQEYLASYLMKNKLCLAIDQKNFSLQKALITARNFEYVQMNVANQNELLPVAENLLHRIAGKKAST